MATYDRLSAQDRSFLDLEGPNTHMHVAGAFVFEPGPVARPEGGIDIDPLTSLLNASGLRRRLNEALRRIPRFKIPLSYGLFVCEGLDQISDEHGAGATDEVRLEVARLLVASLRDTDLIARVRPDTFAVGLPGAPLEFGVRTMQRLCDLVSFHPFFVDGQPVEFRVRAGLTASSPSNLRSVNAMLTEAGRALTLARDAGLEVVSVPSVANR